MKRYPKLAIVLFVSAVLYAYCLYNKPPLKSGISFSQAVYDKNQQLLRLTLSKDDKYRLWLPLKDISPVLAKATLLHEDRYFRWHPGFNAFSLVRAVRHTYIIGDRRIGGSTITMQLVRIRFGINSKTFWGKLSQISLATLIEMFYSKNEILESYLNLVPYGFNIEGVGAASLIYFKKNADQLTLPEALTLSVIPQNPTHRIFDGNKGNEETISKARMRLFSKWIKTNPKDIEQKAIVELPFKIQRPKDLPFLAPHFVNSVLQVYPVNTLIITPLDLDFQKLIERHARNYVESKSNIGIKNVSVMLIDYRSMEVKAVLGSLDFFNEEIHGQVNGTKAKRSPGSAIKPFIYALGIDQGIIHPMTMLKDVPTSFGGYNPENFDHEFTGPIKAKDALIRSRNLPAVQISTQLASPSLYQFLKNAGVSQLKEESFYGMTIALGSAELTMEELVKLYASLANGGVLKPIITNKKDKEENEVRLLSKEASFLVLEMLKENPRPAIGYRPHWTRDQISIAWKTGTSYSYRDAWTIGIFGQYVLAVWIGNFSGEGNPAFVGIEAAAPLFFRIVDSIKAMDHNFQEAHPVLHNLNVTTIEVCSVSGQLPSPFCNHTIETWFIPGKSPIKICDIHREVIIDNKTGLRACTKDKNRTRSVIYEFWPSDMLNIFKKAGIPMRTPPPYNPGCPAETKFLSGIRPQITSPQKGITYNLRASNLKNERIPLTAITDADTTEIFWFINEKFIGKSKRGKTFFWSPNPGDFVVRVVDNYGRSDSRDIKIVVVK